MKVSVTDKDKGMAKMMAMFLDMGPSKVRVGVLGDAPKEGRGGKSGGSLLQVAAVHEFGFPEKNIPKRSFIAEPLEYNHKKYTKGAAQLIRSYVLLGRSTKHRVLDLIGLRMVGDIKKRIAEGISPPLHPRTVARKGSSTPLIDTGQLRNSIAHKVT